MKKLIIPIVLVLVLFLSCEKTDPRLNGKYVYKLDFGYDDIPTVTEEIEFKGNLFYSKTTFSNNYVPKNKSQNMEYDFKYKIKIFLINSKGGVFFSIPSSLPNSYFNNSKYMETYNYIIDGDKLFLEKNKEMKIYMRK